MAESHDVVSSPFTVNLIRIKARQLCRRSDFSRSDFDDLQQDMCLHLLEKAHLFDPARGNLEAFVTKILGNWVAMRLRYRNREKRRESYKVVSLERTRVECDGDITALGVILVEADGRRLSQTYTMSEAERFELREAIEHAMQCLEPDDRALLMQVAEHGITSTAKSLGISWRQVDNAMKRMRAVFKKSGSWPQLTGALVPARHR